VRINELVEKYSNQAKDPKAQRYIPFGDYATPNNVLQKTKKSDKELDNITSVVVEKLPSKKGLTNIQKVSIIENVMTDVIREDGKLI